MARFTRWARAGYLALGLLVALRAGPIVFMLFFARSGGEPVAPASITRSRTPRAWGEDACRLRAKIDPRSIVLHRATVTSRLVL